MNPLKLKDILPKVSQETNLPLDLLKDLNDFYWQDVHRSMTSLDHLHVNIPHLGTFSVKGDIVIDRELARLVPIAARMGPDPPKTPIRYQRWKAINTNIEKLNLLKQRFLDDRKKEKEIKQIRKDVRLKKDMEKQNEYPGGSSQLNPDQTGDREGCQVQA